jgi:hypothetical protein
MKKPATVDAVLDLRMALEAVKRARKLTKLAGATRAEKALGKVQSTVNSALRTADKRELHERLQRNAITAEQAKQLVDGVEPELRRRHRLLAG